MMRLGKCSLCGGAVVMDIVNTTAIPQLPRCTGCGALKKEPTIEMDALTLPPMDVARSDCHPASIPMGSTKEDPWAKAKKWLPGRAEIQE